MSRNIQNFSHIYHRNLHHFVYLLLLVSLLSACDNTIKQIIPIDIDFVIAEQSLDSLSDQEKDDFYSRTLNQTMKHELTQSIQTTELQSEAIRSILMTDVSLEIADKESEYISSTNLSFLKEISLFVSTKGKEKQLLAKAIDVKLNSNSPMQDFSIEHYEMINMVQESDELLISAESLVRIQEMQQITLHLHADIQISVDPFEIF